MTGSLYTELSLLTTEPLRSNPYDGEGGEGERLFFFCRAIAVGSDLMPIPDDEDDDSDDLESED